MFAVDGMIGRLAQLLTDEDFDFWHRDFHLSSIEEAVHTIIKLKPEATARRADVPLVAGSVQALPDGAASLLDVTAVDGRGITRYERGMLDKIDPCWRKAAQIAGIEGYAYDAALPLEFWVYPTAKGDEVASVAYSAMLAVEAGGSVDLGTEYVKHVINFCLYRAYQREGTQTQKEQFYRNAFYDGMGVMQQAAQAEVKA